MSELEKLLNRYKSEAENATGLSLDGYWAERILKLIQALRSALPALDISYEDTSDLYYLNVLKEIEEILKV